MKLISLKKFKEKNIIYKKYLISGFINTLFAYFSSVVLYNLFHNNLGILFVSVFSWVLSINFNFFNYRLFVFKINKFLFDQYIKYYLTNFFLLFFSTFNLYFFIKVLNLNIYLTQLISISMSIVIGFFLNTKIVFTK